MRSALCVVVCALCGTCGVWGSPVVGFDFDAGSGSPTNWNSGALAKSSGATQAFYDLIDESGSSTQIDLTLTNSGALNLGTAIPNADTVPQHSNPLTGISDYAFSSTGTPAALTATFSDLVPGESYYVWVFGLRSFAGRNAITIGGETTASFAQLFEANDLWVNSAPGADGQTLMSYAEIISADAGGEIAILAGTDTSYAYAIGGYAIQMVPEPSVGALGAIAAVLALVSGRRR